MTSETLQSRCIHLGPGQERRRVRTLLSAMQLVVSGCGKHGKCTATIRVPGVEGCCAPTGQAPCPDYQENTFRLVAPLGTADLARKWEGRCAQKSWQYAITVAIPHLDTLELLEQVVRLHR